MPNERSAIDDFLNGVSEPEDIFTEQSTEEPIEKEEEKPLRFDKDPKVQKYIAKQVEKALKDKAPTAEETFKREVGDVKVPESLVNLIGNDTPEKQKALKDFAETLSNLKGEARQEFLAEMKTQEAQKVEADRKAQDELNEYFDEIEEEYSVDLSSNSAAARQLRSQFIEYVRKIAPKDKNGEVKEFPDLVASFEEFQEKNKRPASRAKELASRGMTRSGDTSNAPVTGKSWKDVERYLDKLKAD